jgi:hypothetical protein
MTEVKMPEPVAVTVTLENGPMFWDVTEINEAGTYCDEDEFPELLFTGAQLQQYGDDRAKEALEMAIQTVLNFQAGWIPDGFTECADAIRALKEQIK